MEQQQHHQQQQQQQQELEMEPTTILTEEEQYILELDDIQRKAFLIAKEHLGTSFNILRSNGFKEWKKSKKQS
jgi:hypothetical protein